jgi:hypothetical protein
MKIVRVALAAGCGLVGLCVSTSAMASYGFCETYAPHQAVRVTPMFDIPAAASDSIDADFETYMEAKLGFNLMPSCSSYGDDEDRAREMQAHVLAQVQQGMPAILDEGFETYVAQKYGSGRKAKTEPKSVAESGVQADASEAVTPSGPSAAELRAERHKAVEERNRAAQAKYESELAAVEEAKRDIEARKAANRAAAEKVLADHARDMEAHAQQVRAADAANLEYKKQLAKPAGAPNAVYRGYSARDCATARLSATQGAGTDSGSHFVEVESEMVSGGCVVRGWYWSTQVGGASRQ